MICYGGPETPFVFIVGAPRSGTYLLNLLLNTHFDIAIPLETHFIPLFKTNLLFWGNLDHRENSSRLFDDIFRFLHIWTYRSEAGRDRQSVHDLSLLKLIPQKESLLDGVKNYKDLVTSLFKGYANTVGKSAWGDKSAFYSHIPTKYLVDSTYNPKIIHIVRDGRDVTLSWMKTWFGPQNHVASARLWRNHVLKRRLWGKMHPDKYIEIKFEKLIQEPDLIFKQIHDFTNLDYMKYSPEIVMNSNISQTLGSGGHHNMLNKALDPMRINLWENKMSKRNQIRFEQIAGDTLSLYDYKLVHSFVKKSKSSIIVRQSFGFLHDTFSVQGFKRIVKLLLPTALGIHSRIKRFILNR